MVTASDSDCVCVSKDTSVVTTSDSDCVCAKGHISGHYE